MAKQRTIGDAIRDARLGVGLQVVQLARVSGISRRTLTRWEYDDIVPSVARRQQIVAGIATRSYEIATRLAGELGVAPPPSPYPAAPPVDVGAVARAALARAATLAADALDVSPRRARAALVIGLRELGAAGLGLDAFVAAFAESATT